MLEREKEKVLWRDVKTQVNRALNLLREAGQQFRLRGWGGEGDRVEDKKKKKSGEGKRGRAEKKKKRMPKHSANL